RLLAANATMDERLARKCADERVALPLRKQVAGIDEQRARADRRVPPDLGGLETVAGPVIGNVAAVVIAAVRGLRPAVIAAGQDEVHLIAAHRTHFGLPQAAIRSESKPQQIAMADRIMMTDPLALGR